MDHHANQAYEQGDAHHSPDRSDQFNQRETLLELLHYLLLITKNALSDGCQGKPDVS